MKKVILALLIISISIFQPALSYGSEEFRELERFIKYIHETYKDEVEFETLMNGAFEGVMNSLGDHYSIFYPIGAEPAVQQGAESDYVGIGVQLETIRPGRAGRTIIVDIIEGGAAERAGIEPFDIVIAVDGKDVTTMLSVEVSALLRGEEGTTVSVTIDRGRLGRHTFVMERQRVVIVGSFYRMIEEDIGYISLRTLEEGAENSFRVAKDELILAGATSLIIDIRNNPGGRVNSALAVADELVSEGYLLHIRQRGEIVESVRATNRQKENVPVILLINENTASAAEILAAALQDNDAAILVGTGTYGKGTAQLRFETESSERFNLSVYEFLRPNMGEMEGIGVTPDYEVRNSLGERREEGLRAYGGFAPFAERTKPEAGDVGLDVFAAQQRLALLGYELNTTAVMDEATVNVIREFQRERGLWPGGVLDFTTKDKIEEATLAHINNDSEEDLQFLKGIELIRDTAWKY